jgi:hypothetical protein
MKYYPPVREIERPLTVTDGIWEISPEVSYSFYDSPYPEPNLIWGYLIAPKIRYGLTNRASFPLFPVPVFEYCFLGTPQLEGDSAQIGRFSSSLLGGIYGGSYSKSDGFRPSYVVGMKSKLKANNILWFTGDADYSGSLPTDVDYFNLNMQLSVGLQITNQMFFEIFYLYHYNRYYYDHNLDDYYDYSQNQGRIQIGYNINRYLGALMYLHYYNWPRGNTRYNTYDAGFGMRFSW